MFDSDISVFIVVTTENVYFTCVLPSVVICVWVLGYQSHVSSLRSLRCHLIRAISLVVDEICDYFGVKITMYFAWLGHYTTALIVPAVVGFIFWVRFLTLPVHGHISLHGDILISVIALDWPQILRYRLLVWIINYIYSI